MTSLKRRCDEDWLKEQVRQQRGDGCVLADGDAGAAPSPRDHAANMQCTYGRWPMLSPEAVSGHYARPA
eukprot:4571377-Prymnesium_polylepis.1